MAFTVPTIEPKRLRAGDTWKWTRAFSQYPSSDGWTLTYVLNLPTGDAPITIAATVVSGTFTVNVPATTTKNYAPGDYSWVARVSLSGDEYTAALGRIEVLADIADEQAVTDDRTQNERILDSIKAMIEGRTSDVQEYEVSGRRIQRMPIKDLLYWQGIYENRVRNERIARGDEVESRLVGVRFGRI